MSARSYDSPLRERQTQQTRDAILDAMVALLDGRRVDEVTTKQLATAAGVSERTVYRHFPDRAALVDGVTSRFVQSAEHAPVVPVRLEDLTSMAVELMSVLEAHHIEAQAEALLNADPRRFGEATRLHTRQLLELVEGSMPDLGAGRQKSIAAVLRVMLSAQTWLRMRAEFGISGDASGPVVAWVVEALIHEVERGSPPPPS
jgi:AcrR family transcriptional regulator